MKVNATLRLLHLVRTSLILPALLSVCNVEAAAQDPVTGAFAGSVVISTINTPAVGASVTITNVTSGATYRRATDMSGGFYAGRLSPGLYKIQITAPGYQHVVVEQRLLIGQVNTVLPVPIVLKPAGESAEGPADIKDDGNLVVASMPNALISVEATDGTYQTKNAVPPGELVCVFDHLGTRTYRVTAELEGYQPATKEVRVLPNRTTAVTLTLTPTEVTTHIVARAGKYYALVIGSNDYRHLPRLLTAETDARAVEAALRESYGFETKLLLNASREQIIVALNAYRREMAPNSNLLIYYAGHGYNDAEVEKAYWLPTDARKEDNANWISADDITVNIKGIPARHILIISDSCYSGTITRGLGLSVESRTPSGRLKYLQKMSEGKSRTLLASGGDEPVADGGGQGHSVFAGALLTGLKQMDRDIFTAEEVYYNFIREVVAGKASQTPEYNPIRNSGHESGDFVFLRKR
jgi:hypothetical protein